MQLVIFDIDGTLTDSNNLDDMIFLKAFQNVFNLNLPADKWEYYKEISTNNDNEITRLVIKNELNSLELDENIKKVKSYFLDSLKSSGSQISEVKGAASFFNIIRKNKDFALGIATGCWRESGIYKLEQIGINIHLLPYSHADLFNDRTKILNDVIEQAKVLHQTDYFDKITYFGDGKWDWEAAQKLYIDFIGIDAQKTGNLKKLGVKKIIKDYNDKSDFGYVKFMKQFRPGFININLL